LARLLIEKGPDRGRSIALSANESVSIGRDSTATFALKDSMTSRIHFRIEFRDGDYWLVDLESMNGTLLNGQMVKESKLIAGDLIKAGDTAFSFISGDSTVGALAGHRMGGYRIVERIGRGGMGTVYKAEQVDLQREVALKVLSEENSADKDFIDLFVHEARASARLNHPNIVQVYDVKRHGNVYYFSMEYVPGGSLQDLLSRGRKVEPGEAVRMLLDAARGLEYAHSKGIIHRDIKPDNLMISEDGVVKIGDLGLARRMDEKIGPSEEGAVIGTPHYIAPEQVMGRPADFRSDIYSLGSTAYRMLAGTTPYQALGIRDLVSLKVKEDPKLLHEISPDVPRSLSDCVHRMMARDPERRFKTAKEVSAALETVSRELSGEGEDASLPVPSAVGNRTLLLATLSLAIVVVGAVIGATVLFDSEPEVPGKPAERPDAKLALGVLRTAKNYSLLKVNPEIPGSLRKGMHEFQLVVDNFGGSSDPQVRKIVEEAEKCRDDLRADLRELEARILFSGLKTTTHSNWRALQDTPGDFRMLDRSVRAFSDFRSREDVKATGAAGLAANWETHLLKWKAEAEKWREAWKTRLSEAGVLEEQGSYREADRRLREFQDSVIRAKLDCREEECGVPEERYHALLLEYEVNTYVEKLHTIAKGEYYKIEKKVHNILESSPSTDREFDEALTLLKPVIRASLVEMQEHARSLQHRVEDEKAAWVEAEADRERELALAVLAREKSVYQVACRKAQELLSQYRFRDALSSLRSRTGAVENDPYRERLEERMKLLGRVVLLSDALLNDFRLGRLKKDFSHSRLKTEGEISGLTETSVTVRLLTSGEVTYYFRHFTPREFHDFARKAFRKMGAETRINLAVTCMEFGLYEEAKKELEEVKSLPEYGRKNGVRALVDGFLRMIRDGLYTGDEEVEAEKRLERVRRFLKEKEFPAARSEVDILKENYGGTRAVQDAQKYIESVVDEIGVKISEEEMEKRDENRTARIRDYLRKTKKETKRRFHETLVQIRKMDDLFSQDFYTAQAYAAFGNEGKSNEYWDKAKKRAEGSFSKEKVSREMREAFCLLHLGMIRNLLLQGQQKKAKSILDEGEKWFGDKAELSTDTWSSRKSQIEDWFGGNLAGIRKEVERLKKTVPDHPYDADLLWTIAETSNTKLDDPAGALGWFLFLLENHPGYDRVKTGECQYAVAGIYFRLMALREAVDGYRKVEEESNRSDLVKSAKNRRAACFRLATRMGVNIRKKR
jgi:serine/threonine protein kinase